MVDHKSSSPENVETQEGDEVEDSLFTEDTDSSLDSACSCSSSSSSSSSSDDGESVSTEESDDNDKNEIFDELEPLQCQDPYAAQVQSWVKRVPIGLGLCPWAIKSQRLGRSKYVTCDGSTPNHVANLIRLEAKALICPSGDEKEDVDDDDDDVHESTWKTTLIVCPHVTEWNNDFESFDSFVKNFKTQQSQLQTMSSEQEEDLESCRDLLQEITLVSFHPEFLHWRGLPQGIQVGSVVQSHKGMSGFQKSQQTFSATVLETHSSVFGQRKTKVQFHDDDLKKPQYVPNDWIDTSGGDDHSSSSSNCNRLGPPLPDNIMHRAPYPTVHLIRNEDLGALCVRDVSRVKRINAKRMMKLGWEGVRQKTEESCMAD